MVIELIEHDAKILFIDEAVFTTNQVKRKTWFGKTYDPATDSFSLETAKSKISFDAIAVVGAINIHGKIVALFF